MSRARASRTAQLETLDEPVARFLALDPGDVFLGKLRESFAHIARYMAPTAARIDALVAVQDHLVRCFAVLRSDPEPAHQSRDDLALNVWVAVSSSDAADPPPDPVATGTRLAPLLVAVAQSGSPEIRRVAQELVLPPGHHQAPVVLAALADQVIDAHLVYPQGRIDQAISRSAGQVATAMNRWRAHHDPAPFANRLVTRIQDGDLPTSPLLLTCLAERGVLRRGDVQPCRDQLLTYGVDMIDHGGAELLAWLGA